MSEMSDTPNIYVDTLGRSARRASQQLVTLNGAAKVAALARIARSISDHKDQILEANARDVAAAQEAKLAPALVERLKLNDKRIAAMAIGIEQIARQVDPVGQTIEG